MMNWKKTVSFVLYIITAVSSADDSWVKYTNGLLSVEFISLELQSALDRINQETGVEFSLSPKMETDEVNDSFADLPLERGIRRLLKGYNYMIIFKNQDGDKKYIDRVILLAKGPKIIHREPSRPEPQTATHSAEEPAAAPQEGDAASPEQPSADVVLQRDASGHYLSAGKINNYAVRFLVDTGATLVVVPGTVARKMNLVREAEQMVSTANGRTKGFTTTLSRVELAGLTINQVPAVILPAMNHERHVLLGMSFLEAFELIQRDNLLLIRQPAPIP
jgi:clan AA aspartic protease (TIGR02281 family)